MDGGALSSIPMGDENVDLGGGARDGDAIPMSDDGGPFNELTFQRRSRHENDQPGEGEILYDMNIPATKCGLIIGRNGDMIRNLQNQASVRMHIVQASPFDGCDKPLRIIGTPENVKLAEKLCQELMDSRDDDKPGFNRFGHSGGDDFFISIKVSVPSSYVGIIIGRGGDNIRRISMQTGTRIQFEHEDTRQPHRIAWIRGDSDSAVESAAQMVREMVAQYSENDMSMMNSPRMMGGGGGSRSNGMKSTIEVTIPAERTGMLIGRGGERIRQICAESGCTIRSCRESASDEPHKTFLVTGDDRELEYAQHLIRDKVGDIMVNATSMFGGGSSRHSSIRHQHQHQHQHHHHANQSPFSSPWSGSGVGAGAGNNIYSSGPRSSAYDNNRPPDFYRQPRPQQQPLHQMQHHQQQHQAPQQHPKAPQLQSIQSTCNHQGQNVIGAPDAGEADYSLHWAAYYRSQGMHDVASAVENEYYARQSCNPPQQQQQQQQ